MNDHIKRLAEEAGFILWSDEKWNPGETIDWASNYDKAIVKYTELVVRECINRIETYEIPVSNSLIGDRASEWTYDALKKIRDDIKETFGVK